MDIISILVVLLLCVVFGTEIYTAKTKVPTVTSFPSARRKMCTLLKAEYEARGKVPLKIFDLGSGNGKLALDIARTLPDCHVTGVELSPVPYGFARLRRLVWRLFGVKNLDFERKDIWLRPVGEADAIVLFINGAICEKMGKKLRAELKPGALILSNETHLPSWTPFEVYKVGLLKLKLPAYRQD